MGTIAAPDLPDDESVGGSERGDRIDGSRGSVRTLEPGG